MGSGFAHANAAGDAHVEGHGTSDRVLLKDQLFNPAKVEQLAGEIAAGAAPV